MIGVLHDSIDFGHDIDLEAEAPQDQPWMRDALAKQRRWETVERTGWTLDQLDWMEAHGYGMELVNLMWYWRTKDEMIRERRKQEGA